MKHETRTWLAYADENLEVAVLQNAQQAVEKFLKAVIVERDLEFRRTHSIRELIGIMAAVDIDAGMSEDEMDLMDSIYVPSKYPVYSALPQTTPAPEICHDTLKIARSVRESVHTILAA